MDDISALKPAMTSNEIACLRKYLDAAGSYVEFGSGGSTLMAVQSSTKRIWSVESDPAWIDLVRRRPEIAAAEQAGRLTLWHADIGPTKAYGYPATPWWRRFLGGRSKWANYYETIWTQAGTAEADLFLVDGRFRVACGLAVAAHCQDDARVAVHDFSPRREYAALLEVYETIDQARNLVVLKRKPGISREIIARMTADFASIAD